MKSYRDIAGDGGSNILGQVMALRERLETRLSRVRHVVAVMSGKGGVGKSTVTAGLATVLAHEGKAVGVVDADLNGPALARMLGVRVQQLRLGPDGVVPAVGAAGVRVMSMDLFLPDEATPVTWRHPGGLAADTTVWRVTTEATVLREFLTDTAWGDLDFLLLDLPPGSDRFAAVAGLLPRLAGVLVVTVPTLVSQAVVRKAITAAQQRGDPLLGLVENMAGYVCPDCGSLSPLFPDGHTEEMAEAMGLPLLARIPFDPRLAAQADAGLPFALTHPDTPAARALASLAEAVEGALQP
ncbi:MAG: ATP-binding protein [Caldilineae bacterium]|nr:MAG: ATP-binding protein [Caldilineae bacterium]